MSSWHALLRASLLPADTQLFGMSASRRVLEV
jgi:hypothetical protein